MSAGAGDINAGGATVYLNLGTNAKDSNVATYIKNEVLQVQTIVKNYAAQTNVSLTSVKSSWLSMRATISGVAGATTSVVQKLVSTLGHVTMYAANLTQVGNTLRGGGMAVLGRFSSVLSDFAARGDVFSTMADKTGVGAEALSALGYAAEQSGVSVDALGRSLSKMQVNLASAKREGGDLKLGALTLDESILGLDADQQFKRLAQEIAAIADPAKRTQAAIDAFAKTKLANIAERLTFSLFVCAFARATTSGVTVNTSFDLAMRLLQNCHHPRMVARPKQKPSRRRPHRPIPRKTPFPRKRGRKRE
ncbi:MAG: hypothetical protein J6333_04710 [Planctomycetes bacterium]|nr:hypothetical protein [Planctomycetota bacterium]